MFTSDTITTAIKVRTMPADRGHSSVVITMHSCTTHCTDIADPALLFKKRGMVRNIYTGVSSVLRNPAD